MRAFVRYQVGPSQTIKDTSYMYHTLDWNNFTEYSLWLIDVGLYHLLQARLSDWWKLSSDTSIDVSKGNRERQQLYHFWKKGRREKKRVL